MYVRLYIHVCMYVRLYVCTSVCMYVCMYVRLYVDGLQAMIDMAYEYGRKWRITFSATKTKCMTFGENRNANIRNINRRKWHMNDNLIDEVQHYVHVGVKLCSYGSTVERTKDATRKGYSIYGSLMGCGLNDNDLCPLTSAHIWQRVSLSSMLYGCELWGKLTKIQMYTLEKTQKTVSKSIQGLNWRTHDEVVRGLLGWFTMNGYIDKMKLLFVHTLVNAHPDSLLKHVFLNEMYNILMYGAKEKSITTDLYHVIKKYDILKYVVCYLQGGRFPNRLVWKSIIKKQIMLYEEYIWWSGLVAKDSRRLGIIQQGIKPNALYGTMSRNIEHKHNIMLLIRFISTVDNDEDMLCTFCDKVITDTVEHVILRCEGLLSDRTIMWNAILDGISVQSEANLLNKPDQDILCILLGKTWAGFQTLSERDNTTLAVSKFIRIVYKHI